MVTGTVPEGSRTLPRSMKWSLPGKPEAPLALSFDSLRSLRTTPRFSGGTPSEWPPSMAGARVEGSKSWRVTPSMARMSFLRSKSFFSGRGSHAGRVQVTGQILDRGIRGSSRSVFPFLASLLRARSTASRPNRSAQSEIHAARFCRGILFTTRPKRSGLRFS